jgi:cytochrome c peroxidase
MIHAMKHLGLVLSVVSILSAVGACDDASVPADPPWDWGLPPAFPLPPVPDDNPMGVNKVELGRRLFYDTRLSGNGTQSCASCHRQDKAFSEARATSIGSTGEIHPRNAMSLANVAYNTTQTWANNLLIHLEDQALVPMFGTDPVELGLSGQEQVLLERIGTDPEYRSLIRLAFGDPDGEPSLDRIVKAIAAFQRALISADSPYDRFFYRRDVSALSPEALRGFELFFSERLECFHCHGGFNFNSSSVHEGSQFAEVAFHNNGLYNLDGQGAYPIPNRGLYEVTLKPEHMGLFKAPTLRNIMHTAPYMHDGSLATIDDVIDHYAAGGRLIEDGPLAGDGRANPQKSAFVRGFALTPEERSDLKSFLEALSDETFLTDPRFSDPFASPSP